jgi:hypothetical protein
VLVVVDVEVLVDVFVLEDVLDDVGDALVVVVGGFDVRVGGVNTGGATVPEDGPGRGGETGTVLTGTGGGTDVTAGIVVVSEPSGGVTGGGLTKEGATTAGAWLVGGGGVRLTFAGSTCALR